MPVTYAVVAAVRWSSVVDSIYLDIVDPLSIK